MFAGDKKLFARDNIAEAGTPQETTTFDSRALADRVGAEYRVRATRMSGDGALLSGCLTFSRLRDGLILHRSDVLHLCDMTTEAVIDEPCVKVLLKLEGDARVCFGEAPLELDAGQGKAARPRGAVVALAVPERFERSCRADSRERMVALTLAPAWLESAGLDFDELRKRLDATCWRPSARAVALAAALIAPAPFSAALAALYQESRAIELAAEALGGGGFGCEPPLSARALARAERLKTLLDSGRADTWDIATIAREMACNPTTLQKDFRQVHRASIFDYLRASRLARAARALECEGVTVAMAAEIAGYSSQANFSTAFRHRYGMPPSAWRRR